MAKSSRLTPKQIEARKHQSGDEKIERELQAENKELSVATGTVVKNKVYYKNLERRIKSDPRHPKLHNIRMQAHHIISETAVKSTGKSYINELLLLGYDINNLENLIFLPSSLQGACHLDVQPHIGNHNAKITHAVDSESSYNDDDHPLDYHDMVRRQLINTLDRLSKTCPSTHPDAPVKAKRRLNQLSLEILILIAKNPEKALLTKVYGAFSSESSIGCGGESSIDRRRNPAGLVKACPVGRNHLNAQGENQKSEEITYVKRPHYQLTPGN